MLHATRSSWLAVLLLTALSTLSAQTVITLSGPATARPGDTIAATLTQAASPASGAAIQFAIALPANYTATTAIGSAATAATKTIQCTADNLFCLVYGLNQTVIGVGPLAVYSIKVPATAAAGPVSFPLSSDTLISSPTGVAVAFSLGTAYSVNVLSLYDLNGDGLVNGADVQIMIDQVKASRTNPAACLNDLNGDGKCNVYDVMILVMKVLGL